MKKCRVVELKEVNELFLQFCVNYDTPEREHYRAIYEAADAIEKGREVEPHQETGSLAEKDGQGSRTHNVVRMA